MTEQVKTIRRGRTAKVLAIALVGLLLAALLWPYASRAVNQAQRLVNQYSGLAKLEPEQRSQVCAHRANSLAKYRLARRVFDCIEIDIVITPEVASEPSVYHPPDSNYRGLSLEQLLQRLSLPRGILWLDVQDLGEANWSNLYSLLGELIPVDRRADIVIETWWADDSAKDAIDAFREAGYLVSYYLPTREAADCGGHVSEYCNAFRADVLGTMRLGFSHLSFDARGYEFVQTLRDELPEGTRLLTWHTSRILPQMDMLDDVDLYVVRFPTPFNP